MDSYIDELLGLDDDVTATTTSSSSSSSATSSSVDNSAMSSNATSSAPSRIVPKLKVYAAAPKPIKQFGQSHLLTDAEIVEREREEWRDYRAMDNEREHAMQRRRFRRGQRAEAYEILEAAYLPAASDKLPWNLANHKFIGSRLLTIADPRAPDPPGFRGHLYPPQATLLTAIMAFEKRPIIHIVDPKCRPAWQTGAQSRMGRINAFPSFGKTVLVLALVCAQKVPARLPEINPAITYATPTHNADIGLNRAIIMTGERDGRPVGFSASVPGGGFIPEVSLRYGRLLPVTVVIAAANVITQWQNETERFTEKRYFIIENVKTLREFETLYRSGEANTLDLVLVKAGRVTTNFVVAGEPPQLNRANQGRANRSLVGALARVLEGVPVARVIVDDFDSLKLTNDEFFLPALFTWLISATRRQTATRYGAINATPMSELHTPADFFRTHTLGTFPVLAAALDDVLNKTFSFNAAPDYVAEHLNSTTITYRKIVVQGGVAAGMLRDLEVPAEVLEMVHAHAIGTAARTLGLEAADLSDVLRRVVGDHLARLRHAVVTLARVAAAREVLAAKLGREKDKERIKDLRHALKDGDHADVTAATRLVAGMSREVEESLASLEEWATNEKTKHDVLLNRMRDNIREGACQCCKVPFKPEDDDDDDDDGEAQAAYVLSGCCQIIVCEGCITQNHGRRREFIKSCPNCQKDIHYPAGLVRVGAEIDLDAALYDEALMAPALLVAPVERVVAPVQEPPAQVAPDEGQHASDDEDDEHDDDAAIAAALREEAAPQGGVPQAAIIAPPEHERPRLRALMQFIRGENIDCISNEVVPPYVQGLLDGRLDVPWPPDRPRKFLIFTMHSEATGEIQRELARQRIPHCVLRGTRAQKDAAVKSLRAGINIMLVTAAKDCSGLNLPFLSHVIFYHRMLDRNVETQVAARGQRLGRTFKLEILTLQDEVENRP